MRSIRMALMIGMLGFAAGPAVAEECDATAIVTVRYYLEARDNGEYRQAERYLSSDFGQHFRDTYGAAYLDYMSDPDVTWRESTIQGSTVAPGQCSAAVSSTREALGVSGVVSEAYTLVETYLGWRIDDWQWQPGQ